MSDFIIRKFQEEDAEEVSTLIIKTLRTTNIKDYSEEYIENDVKMFTPEGVKQRAVCLIYSYCLSTREKV